MNIQYKTITLRAFEPEDVDRLYAWENDPESWRVSNIHAPLSKHNLVRYVEASHRDIWESKEMRLMIENADKKPVGTVELFDFDPYHSRAGVGIMIYNKKERRKGNAGLALEALSLYARNELGIFQLYANVSDSNKASVNLFRKNGFEVTGVKTKWLRTPGGREDEILMQKVL
ncbi:MAG TPA: GNAT family N-acetyltransferase [Prolixibacteraceae bacterium]|nr:GNAT family N-acetyltransferase [Prolixibacteraceae bacterium]